MKVQLIFKWFDFWIGIFYDQKKNWVYFLPIPMVGIIFKLPENWRISSITNRLFPHKHKWQIRGQNRYGGDTYRICLKCRETFKRVNNSWEDDRWEKCDPIPELDNQFDSNDKYIFNEQ